MYINIIARVEDTHRENRLHFLSGKWFDENLNSFKDMSEVRKYIVTMYPDLEPAQVDKFINCFLDRYNYPDHEWPKLKILETLSYKAGLEINGYMPTKIPLTKEQYKIIHYLIDREDQQDFLFIVWGCGGSGKSTFLNIIQHIFENDFASATISDITSQFGMASAINHRLICSSEISDRDIRSDKLKQIISREHIQVEAKGCQAYYAKVKSSMIFMCNEPPKIDFTDTGLERRVLFYEMNKKIDKPDKSLAQMEWTEADLVPIVVNAMKTPIDDLEEAFKDCTRRTIIKNSSIGKVLAFGERFYKIKSLDELDPFTYRMICKQLGLQPYSIPKFCEMSDKIKEWLNV